MKSGKQGKRGAAGLGVGVGTSFLSGAGDQCLFVVPFIAFSDPAAGPKVGIV